MPLLTERIRRVTHAVDPGGRVPLHVHRRYSRDEVLAAFGEAKPDSVRQGVKFVEEEKSDLFFVTLRKTEAHYSPTTMYNDRAITSKLFQWESQSTTSECWIRVHPPTYPYASIGRISFRKARCLEATPKSS